MKRRFQRVMALAGALLFGAMIIAGVPGMTAKAEGSKTVTRPNRVVHGGDILPRTMVCWYLSEGSAEEMYKKVENNDATNLEAYLLHGDIDVDYYLLPNISEKDYWNKAVLADEEGTNGYIIRVQTEKVYTINGVDEPLYEYYLEPYYGSEEVTPSDSDTGSTTAPTEAAAATSTPVYVEPAWLTAWKGLLTGIDKQIADAKAGDTVILELGEYYNISNARMQQIAEKNDVTFILHITYDKVSYSLTIEPGTEIDLSCDWYGPLKLLSMFPYEIVE